MTPSQRAVAASAATQVRKRTRRPRGRSLLALALLFTATSAMGGQTHPFISEFTGSDTPDGSLGSTADRVAVRQSTGDVYVIDKTHGVVDIFEDRKSTRLNSS